jgi:serine/threonine protein phosphatase PrpC
MAIWQDSLEHAQLSDVGMRRRNNQDSFGFVLAADDRTWKLRGHVLMVADGMGAHAAGELASKIAVETVPHLYLKLLEQPPGEALKRAISETNAEVNRRGAANPEFHKMGTTSSVLVLMPDAAWVGHVGDSRVYRLRRNTLEQLTFDHSLVWEARRDNSWPAGLDPQQALPKNVITRSLGPNAEVEVDVEGPFPLEAGDTFLLCSDGLTGMLTDDELACILANHPAEEAAASLVDLANLRGGSDNITVLVARVLPAWITKQGDGALPPVATASPTAEVHPAVWVASGVCGLLSLGVLVAGQMLFAGIGALLAGAIIGLGFLLRGSAASGPSIKSGAAKTYQPPYSQTPYVDANVFLDKLATLVRDLRDTALDASLDLSTFDKLCQRASDLRRSGQSGPALRQLTQAISGIMSEFRRRKRNQHDSVVDL